MATSPREFGIPARLLRAAIDGVPAVKYALGIAGVISALAIVKGFFASTGSALLAAAAMLILMSMLLVFAAASKLGPTSLRLPALIFTWATMIFFVTAASLTLTSVFFSWPRAFPAFLGDVQQLDSNPSKNITSAEIPLLVRVKNEATGEPVANAAVYVDDAGREACPLQFSQVGDPVRCALDEGDYRVVVGYKEQTRSQPVHVSRPETRVTISIPAL
ncbi:MAG TPA: hypothetical protein VNW97_09070 [Candidatus Saccharimonadales bacterium]|nr:hypothetical protein [Candidatus Saccharimonadales bacterium]